MISLWNFTVKPVLSKAILIVTLHYVTNYLSPKG